MSVTVAVVEIRGGSRRKLQSAGPTYLLYGLDEKLNQSMKDASGQWRKVRSYLAAVHNCTLQSKVVLSLSCSAIK